MLTARKNSVINHVLYRFLVHGAVRASFSAVHVRQPISAVPPANMPVILFGNHCSWWDGYMAMLINERIFHRDGYVMVEDIQLSRYQFFRYLGAFSIDRTNRRAAYESMVYAAELLHCQDNRLLLIFPQGAIQANDRRPLGFYNGIGHIAQKAAPCQAIPVALRYEFIGEQKPEAFIRIGAPTEISGSGTDAKTLTKHLELALSNELDHLYTDVVTRQFASYNPLVHGSWSINRLWDSVRNKQQIRHLGPH
jgi:chlorobactene lauroyltransferase